MEKLYHSWNLYAYHDPGILLDNLWRTIGTHDYGKIMLLTILSLEE